MKQHILHATFGLLLVLILSNPASSAEFAVMTGSLPPYSINKGLHLKGISVDTLVIIMSLAGSSMEADDVKLMPWRHAFKKTKTGPRHIMLNVPKTDQYAELFKWVGPIHTSKYVLIGRRENRPPVTVPAGLDTLKTATIRGSAPEKVLLKAGVAKAAIMSSSTHITPLRQLKNEQVDFFAYGNYCATYLMRKVGMNPQEFKVFYTLEKVPLYYAFSHDTDDAFIRKLNENLKEMKHPGPDGKSQFAKIVAKYLPDGAISGQ